jgi:hypothetical protein
VNEFNDLEGQYVVRGRNAHAWAMAYLNGNWQFFDTTPGSWSSEDAKTDAPWQRLLDLWSLLVFKFTTGMNQLVNLGGVNLLVGGMAISLLPFLWWLRQKLRHMHFVRPPQAAGVMKKVTGNAGSDSEFYAIAQALAEVGLNRRPGEALTPWQTRLKAELTDQQFSQLSHILDLHHSYRFDPQGLSASERQQLRVSCEAWLQDWRSHTPALNSPKR